jgi:hypothetical protein
MLDDDLLNLPNEPTITWASSIGGNGAHLWSVSAYQNRALLVGWLASALNPPPIQPTVAAYYQNSPPTPGCNGFIVEFVLHSCVPCPNSQRIMDFENYLTPFPNPTTGIFNITIPEVSETSKITITVYDLLGNDIYQNEFTGNKATSIDISDKSQGLYIIKISIGNSAYISKIIYQK